MANEQILANMCTNIVNGFINNDKTNTITEDYIMKTYNLKSIDFKTFGKEEMINFIMKLKPEMKDTSNQNKNITVHKHTKEDTNEDTKEEVEKKLINAEKEIERLKKELEMRN